MLHARKLGIKWQDKILYYVQENCNKGIGRDSILRLRKLISVKGQEQIQGYSQKHKQEQRGQIRSQSTRKNPSPDKETR